MTTFYIYLALKKPQKWLSPVRLTTKYVTFLSFWIIMFIVLSLGDPFADLNPEIARAAL